MSGILVNDFESFEAATFRTPRTPFVLTSTTDNDTPLVRTSWRHVIAAGEPWTNATGVEFAAEDLAELAVGEVALEEAEFERVVADTQQPRPIDFLARMLDEVSRPTEREDVALSVDPDDYPLF